MSDLVNYLNSPHLVAGFQKIFGIESHFDSHQQTNSIKIQQQHTIEQVQVRKVNKTPAINPKGESLTNHKRNSSNPKKLVNITDHRDLIANTYIHNRFWYYFFHLGAAMGNEIFYCLFFPFWFWNVDGAIARRFFLFYFLILSK